MRTFERGKTVLSACLAAGLLATALASTPAPAKTPKDTLVLGWTLAIYRTLDPADIGETFVDEMMNNVCDPLVFQDYENPAKLVPGIAESWSVTDDALTYTFKIRKGLKFPSGNPVTAHDAAWSIQRNVKLNLNSAVMHKEWGFTDENVIENVTASDDHTLVVKVTEPFAPPLFLAQVFTGRAAFTLDRKEIMKHEKDGDWGNGWLSKTSACVGPYRVKTWKANDVFIIERNDDYWRNEVKIKRIVVRHVPEGGAQRLLLEKGDIDIARNITSSDFEAIESNPDLVLFNNPMHSYWYIGLCTCDDVLQSRDIREAFKWLVDYKKLESTVMRNVGVARQSVVPIGAFGAIPSEEEPYSLNLDKAKELIAKAGYADGFKKKLIIDQVFPFPEIAQHVQANAAKIGIELEIQPMAAAQLYGQFRSRDFESGIFAWTTGVPDAHGMVSRHVFNPDNSDEFKGTMFPAWRVGWDVAALGLNEKVLAAKMETDTEKRRKMYHEIQRVQLAESPFVYMFQKIENIAMRKEVKGLPITAFKKFYAMAHKE